MTISCQFGIILEIIVGLDNSLFVIFGSIWIEGNKKVGPEKVDRTIDDIFTFFFFDYCPKVDISNKNV